ncbi:integrin alpha-V-like [Pararge aegeria]|uniref:integrin alpha-V-like n=1 Tax=Pararge aegeria TaxID=116150 RepID=UPI0019D1AE5B|nr:integrin alpha-V-like [Pararge aegeria]
MPSYTVICFLQAAISPIFGFFHEPSTISVTRPGLNQDSFFGFSMAYDEKTLVIGAPAADEYGKVFKVSLSKDVAYEEIISPLRKENYTEAKYDWFGASIKKYEHQSYVICAPRKIHLFSNQFIRNMTTTRGQCYIRSENWLLLPDIRQDERSNFNYQMDSFGWSVDVDDNRALWIASPAIHNNTIKIYDESTYYLKSTKFLAFDPSKLYNFGYSILSGNFLSVEGNDHAVSNLYGDYGKGKVILFENLSKRLELSDEDSSVGSAYGAALCKAYFGDERASLLVGAPTLMTGRTDYDRGAVFIYVPHKYDKTLIFKRKIVGTKDGGHFGHAIASLGDMDGDQRDEVAISAPFEDEGKGAVYIYSGAGLLGSGEAIQRISRESKAFGFSLQPMPNYTNNALNGLSVGAPLENMVYVIKPIPSITVEVDVLSNPRISQDDQPYITITTALIITYPNMTENISTKLDVKLRIEHPHAKLENATSDGILNYKIPLDVTVNNLTQTFRIFTPNEGNYGSPITYELAVDLFDKDDKYEGRVIRSERSVMSKGDKLWVSNCRAAVCVPNLTVDINTKINDPYSVGSSDKEYFSLTIHNSGETAYTPCAIVNVQEVLLLRAPSDCIIENNGLVCALSHPLSTNRDWNITNIELGMDTLTTKKKGRNNITIVYEIYNDCNNKTDRNSANKSFTLRYDNGVHLFGISVPSEPVEITRSDLKNVTRLQHHYTIVNNGKINWKDAKCYILLHTRNYLQYSQNITIRRGPNTTECSLNGKKAVNGSFTVACSIGDLYINNIIDVFIDVEVLPHFLGKERVSISSQLSLTLLDEEPVSKNITTTLVINTRSVPAWVIIISVLFGILILLLIVFILYKCNCFERKSKKKLEGLKTQPIDAGEVNDGVDGNENELPEDVNIIVAVEPHIEPYVEPNVDPSEDHSNSRLIN